MTGDGPAAPVAAVIAVTCCDREVLLVRRYHRPNAGLWGFPGGKLHYGEGCLAAAERELFEETGVTARARRAFDAVDVIDDGTPPAYHYVLVAVLMDWQAGQPVPDDDVDDAAWFPWDGIPATRSPNVDRVLAEARRLLGDAETG